MYIFKNAFRNITRNKGRNILIGTIIIVIASACTVALAINNTSNNLINSYKDAYEVEATIGFSRGNMMGNFKFNDKQGMEDMKDAFNSIKAPSIEDIESYAESEYVKNYYYTYSVQLNANNIEKVSSDFSFEDKGDRRGNQGNMPNLKEQADFTLNSYSSIETMEEFINGNYSMIESDEDIWNKIFYGNYCIINEELKTLNELSLNSEIEFVDSSGNIYRLTVIGIYSEKEAIENKEFSMFSSSANKIITNTDIVKQIVNNSDSNGTLNPTFILTSYYDAENFQNELYSKGMSEYYTVTTNEEEVNSATSSVSNVKSFAVTFLIITFIIGSIVLFIINQINLRERKYEIGVLRTIGMKKNLLTLQFVSELLIVAIIALFIGSGIGAILSKPISNSLLANEISSSEEKIENIGNNFGGNIPNGGNRGKGEFGGRNSMNIPGIVNVQAYDSINAVVNIEVLFQLFIIGIFLTLISSTSSMISIQKFSPLQILKERS